MRKCNGPALVKVHGMSLCYLPVGAVLIEGDTRSRGVRPAIGNLTANAVAIGGIPGHVSLNIGVHNINEAIRLQNLTARGAADRSPAWARNLDARLDRWAAASQVLPGPASADGREDAA